MERKIHRLYKYAAESESEYLSLNNENHFRVEKCAILFQPEGKEKLQKE